MGSTVVGGVPRPERRGAFLESAGGWALRFLDASLVGGFVLSEPSLLEVVCLESGACAGAGCVDSPAFSALEPLD